MQVGDTIIHLIVTMKLICKTKTKAAINIKMAFFF